MEFRLYNFWLLSKDVEFKMLQILSTLTPFDWRLLQNIFVLSMASHLTFSCLLLHIHDLLVIHFLGYLLVVVDISYQYFLSLRNCNFHSLVFIRKPCNLLFLHIAIQSQYSKGQVVTLDNNNLRSSFLVSL